MLLMDTDWIREGLKRAGKSQRGLAAYLGLDPSAISRLLAGERLLKADEVARIAAYLSVPAPAPDLPSEAPQDMDATAAVPPFTTMRRDVPVVGTVVGGSSGAFELNGSVVDYVRRPPGIERTRGVYALYVSGESMVPRYDPGDLVFLNPSRPPRAGDYVVIEMFAEEPGQAGQAYIKRLRAVTPNAYVAEQFNPPLSIEYPIAKVRQIIRIIPTAELLGT